MKKFLIFIVVLVVFVGVGGYAIYYYGTNLASQKLMDAVSTELENSGQTEKVKQFIENDSELKKFVEEAASVDDSSLPFTTKEEATRVLVKKIGVTKLLDIKAQAQEGTLSKEEVLADLQGKLSEEELLALKVIAYKELYHK
ncbi:hypothetical protein [Peribacillus huizhouensis]|uniref:Phenylalanyl-tRNA synthetase subunit beta n=1 Tax=Peribacillus huizhouensis TaxID=1501239 RepID=A0ABR6CPL2_9BACI|nr:hypothetical protein [Peribacillus huizhouensis]MBA9026965.1 hypothetical protein [Peribacillus huizhouensis]